MKNHHPIGAWFGNGAILEGDGAAGGGVEAGYHVEEGGFAAAGVTDQADEFTFVDSEIDAVEDGCGAVDFGDSIEGEECGFGLVEHGIFLTQRARRRCYRLTEPYWG